LRESLRQSSAQAPDPRKIRDFRLRPRRSPLKMTQDRVEPEKLTNSERSRRKSRGFFSSDPVRTIEASRCACVKIDLTPVPFPHGVCRFSRKRPVVVILSRRRRIYAKRFFSSAPRLFAQIAARSSFTEPVLSGIEGATSVQDDGQTGPLSTSSARERGLRVTLRVPAMLGIDGMDRIMAQALLPVGSKVESANCLQRS